ncbi:hypothetical protein Sjap_021973 [Stephania japonica]|uniref:Protein kinase domain-containing protein n=1 Tax=Stephania japonica TaxID=461633 RepID=A0AAP0ENG2_9MAGN
MFDFKPPTFDVLSHLANFLGLQVSPFRSTVQSHQKILMRWAMGADLQNKWLEEKLQQRRRRVAQDFPYSTNKHKLEERLASVKCTNWAVISFLQAIYIIVCKRDCICLLHRIIPQPAGQKYIMGDTWLNIKHKWARNWRAIVHEFPFQVLLSRGNASLVKILRDCALALKFLHSHPDGGIVHEAIKLSNILLNNNMEVKLSNLGLAKMLDSKDQPTVSVDLDA